LDTLFRPFHPRQRGLIAGERPEAREVARLRRELAALEERIAIASERFLTEKDAEAAEVHRATFGQLLARKQAIESQVKQAELHKADEPDVDALIAARDGVRAVSRRSARPDEGGGPSGRAARPT
jgi:hypothetical protein